MKGKTFALIGVVALILVGAFLVISKIHSNDPVAKLEKAEINCVGGSEKKEILDDPKIKEILNDRYHLRVNYDVLETFKMVQLSTDELAADNVSCIWSSSTTAQQVFEGTHTLSDFKGYRAEVVIQSPEVLYSGPNTVKELESKKIVKQAPDGHLVINMKRLLQDVVLKGKDLNGRPSDITSTDPVKSYSGFVLYQMLLPILAVNSSYKSPSLAQAQKVFPEMRRIYDEQGLQPGNSTAGFQGWLNQGAEQKAPLYAGYENNAIKLLIQGGGDANAGPQFKARVRTLYPEPTIYADHPILALNKDGKRFIDAMKDPEIQTIIWQKYGLRSATRFGADDAKQFKSLALANDISATSPPSYRVSLALRECLMDEAKCR